MLDKSGAVQTGIVYGTNCSTGSGCVVAETKPNSYGAGFAQAGGGVWATQLDVSGVYMWFWSVSCFFFPSANVLMRCLNKALRYTGIDHLGYVKFDD